MLRIFLGDMPGAVYHPPTYFDNQYRDEWITDPFSVEVMEDIYGTKIDDPHLFESPSLGPITVKTLSGGVKTLLLFRFDESGKVFNASTCGNNCAKWILKIAETKDLTINLRHIMNFGDVCFDAEILNTGEITHNASEFGAVAGQFV